MTAVGRISYRVQRPGSGQYKTSQWSYGLQQLLDVSDPLYLLEHLASLLPTS